MYLYLHKDTPLHRLHPVTKILGTFLLFVPPLATTDPVQMLLPTGITGGIAVIGRCLSNIRRMGNFMLKLGIFSFLLWVMFIRGEHPMFRIGSFTVTEEAFRYGVAMAVRLNLLLLTGIIFLSTTRIEEVTVGLQSLGMPFRVGFAISFAFRLVPLLFDTGATVVQAQRARGMDFESGGILERVRRYAPLLIPMILSTIRGADLTAMALESRGFGAGYRRTSYLGFRWGISDAVAIGILVAIDIWAVWFSQAS